MGVRRRSDCLCLNPTLPEGMDRTRPPVSCRVADTPAADDDACQAVDGVAFDAAAPMTRAFNHVIAGPHFRRRFGRWPLPAADPRSTINDVIFDRMIDPRWTPLERAFVDKETAKREAQRLSPGLRVPETRLVVAMDDVPSPEALFDRLHPFVGTATIAKPTHASGGTVFLRDVTGPEDLRRLFWLARADYASILREMQYWRLPRKIIVEALVPSAAGISPDDYKFHCVRGQPLVCQVDHSRFGRPWSRLYRVPSFEPMDRDDGLAPPAGHALPTAERIAAMMAAARALSAPFEFVRVDLYDGSDGVYFGELTFTPAASLGIAPAAAGDHAENATHRVYSGIVMAALAGDGQA